MYVIFRKQSIVYDWNKYCFILYENRFTVLIESHSTKFL